MFASSISALLTNLGPPDGGETPELILLATQRIQIWFDGEHLIEADSRQATVGKYYLDPIGEVILYRVVDIEEQSTEETGFRVSAGAEEIMDGPADELSLQHCYTLTQDKQEPYEGVDADVPREMFEHDGSLGGYRDPPPIPFVKLEEAVDDTVTMSEKQQQISDFE